EPQAVGAFGPGQIRRISVLPVVADHRAPVVGVAEGSVAADIENREAALAHIGTVGSGNLQHVEADVLPVIRAFGIVMHARAAKIGVQQESWGDYIGKAAAEHVRAVVAGPYARTARRTTRIAAERPTQWSLRAHRR